jgi:23S rRNA (uridine2552-2'-O)-methyltransferase
MKGTGKKGGLGDIASRRRPAVRVKAKKTRTESSRRWLQRQLNDPYAMAAKEDGYRSRAAYKILQIDEQFHFLRKGQRVVDLGAAPGGWSQVVAKKNDGTGKLVALDIIEMVPIKGAEIICLDFLSDDAPEQLKALLGGPADVVLSDMAPSTIGHARTDHIRIMAMAEAAAMFAIEVLKPGGSFVCKFFQGGAEKSLMDVLKKHFTKVKFTKPAASRSDSSENYLLAMGFRK